MIVRKAIQLGYYKFLASPKIRCAGAHRTWRAGASQLGPGFGEPKLERRCSDSSASGQGAARAHPGCRCPQAYPHACQPSHPSGRRASAHPPHHRCTTFHPAAFLNTPPPHVTGRMGPSVAHETTGPSSDGRMSSSPASWSRARSTTSHPHAAACEVVPAPSPRLPRFPP